jgi:hypothetical protein
MPEQTKQKHSTLGVLFQGGGYELITGNINTSAWNVTDSTPLSMRRGTLSREYLRVRFLLSGRRAVKARA